MLVCICFLTVYASMSASKGRVLNLCPFLKQSHLILNSIRISYMLTNGQTDSRKWSHLLKLCVSIWVLCSDPKEQYDLSFGTQYKTEFGLMKWLNVLAWAHTSYPSEHSSKSGHYKMWGKSLCCGVSMYVVHYISLWVSLLCIMIQSRVWVPEGYAG